MSDTTRRPVQSRGKKIFHDVASALVRAGVTPNQVSIASMGFAAIAAAGFFVAAQNPFPAALIGIAFGLFGIQGRLICNLVDGLMAVEGSMKTPTGELYNEIPDRVSDTLIFLGAALSAEATSIHAWGWAASLFAMATAYIRVLGASQGVGHSFTGPMAKQHRMFLMNLCLVGCAWESSQGAWGRSIEAILAVIAAGAFVTCGTRLTKIAAALNLKK